MNTLVEDARALLIESKEYLGSISANDWSARRERFIQASLPPNKPSEIVEKIRRAVCDYYGITVKEMFSSARPERIFWPRHVAMYLCLLSGMTLEAVGHAFERDHTTALNARKSVEGRISCGKKWRKEVEDLQKVLNP